jgi:hypothetical protein
LSQYHHVGQQGIFQILQDVNKASHTLPTMQHLTNMQSATDSRIELIFHFTLTGFCLQTILKKQQNGKSLQEYNTQSEQEFSKIYFCQFEQIVVCCDFADHGSSFRLQAETSI